MVFRIEFKSSVSRDLKQIDKKIAGKILSQINETLAKNPSEMGEPLKGEFSGLYKIRLGDYRIIYAIIKNETVLVLRIRHRSKSYE